MLKTLVKKQLAEIFRSYFVNQKTNQARPKASTVAFFVFFLLVMVGMLGGIFTVAAVNLLPLAFVGLEWMYFALMGLIGLLLGMFGSVFNTYAGLYLAKDNDLLLSLPIPPRTIMNARLLGVYLMGLMYSAVVTVPMAVVYWVNVSAAPAALVGGLLMIFAVSLLTLVLSALLGYVVARVSLKLKNKSFLTVLLALVFLGAYYFFYFKASSLLQGLLENAAFYGEKIRGAAYPLYVFGRAGAGDWLSILLVLVVTLLAFGLVWWVLSRSFLKIATSTGKTARVVYKEKAVKRKSQPAALLGRELRHFFSNPGYMLNCGLGSVFVVLAGLFLLFKGPTVIELFGRVFGERPSVVPALLTGVICLISALTIPAAPSISLEGKSVWLLQSLPVDGWEVLLAKLRMQLLIAGVPALFATLCLLPAVGTDLLSALAMLLAVTAFCLFNAAWSMTMGVVKANLSWTREIVPIKQGMAVLLSMLGGGVIGLLLTVGAFLFPVKSAAPYLGGAAVILLALSFPLLRWLKGSGAKRFECL